MSSSSSDASRPFDGELYADLKKLCKNKNIPINLCLKFVTRIDRSTSNLGYVIRGVMVKGMSSAAAMITVLDKLEGEIEDLKGEVVETKNALASAKKEIAAREWKRVKMEMTAMVDDMVEKKVDSYLIKKGV